MAKRAPKKSQKKSARQPAKKAAPKKPAKRPAAPRKPAKKQNQNRLLIVAILAGITLAALAGVILATVFGDDSSSEPVAINGGAEVTAMLQGIPQENNVLGDPNAPVTMIEYADLKCPQCGKFASTALPQIINEYVRTGKLRIEFKVQTFVNNQKTPGDTEKGARFALAAGQQDRLWNFVELFYKNQPDEDLRYFTDGFLTSLGNEVPGLDVSKAFDQSDSDVVSQELSDYKQAFTLAGFDGVPAFQIGKTGSPLTNMTIKSLDYSVFKSAIDNLL